MILRRRAMSIGLSTLAALLLSGFITACGSMTPTPADLGQPQTPASPVLKIYANPDQFAPDILAAFEQKYGAKIALSTYESDTELLNTLLNGPTDFDLVLARGYVIPQLRTSNLLAPLNKDDLPNLENLMPEFQNSSADPGNRHCVPYQWGTMGIGYNPALTGQDIVSWSDFFSHTQARRLALPNSPRVTLGLALLATGNSPNTTEKANLEKARVLLTGQAGHMISYIASPVQQLLDGRAAAVVDRMAALIAASRQNPALKYALPREGTLLWRDYLCLMKDTPHPALAEHLLNDLLDPATGLAAVRFTGQSSPNAEVVSRLPPQEQSDPVMYPAADSAQRDRLFALAELSQAANGLYDETWKSLQTDR